MEQTRKKYQMEFSTLTDELEMERENVLKFAKKTLGSGRSLRGFDLNGMTRF